jgi:hypothetical protein
MLLELEKGISWVKLEGRVVEKKGKGRRKRDILD